MRYKKKTGGSMEFPQKVLLATILALSLVVPAFAQMPTPDSNQYEIMDRGSIQCDRNIYDVAVLRFKDLPDSIAPDAYVFILDGQPYAILLMEWGPDREDPDSAPLHAYYYTNGTEWNVDAFIHDEKADICSLLEPHAMLASR